MVFCRSRGIAPISLLARLRLRILLSESEVGTIGAALDRGAKTVRVGFEDSNYVDESTTTTNNYDLVAKAVKVMAEHDCEPMTPEEARKLLHIGY